VRPYQLRCSSSVGASPIVRFSQDGRALAVGTADGAVQVFEADTVLARGACTPENVLRRYTDHKGAVNDAEFHPTSPILVTASEDATLHFNDVPSNRTGPSRTCTDTHPVRSVAFHPGGSHLLVGTTHAALHIYDVSTFRCFLSAEASDHHQAAIADARWAADGSLFASCAAAEVKLWDGHNCRCVLTLGRSHGGTPVGSVAFSRNGHHVLTSGADSAVKLWDIRAARVAANESGRAAPMPMRTFEGGAQSTPRRVACFSHDESLVIGADEANASAIMWPTASDTIDTLLGGEICARCTGHKRPIRCLAHAPGVPAFVSTGEDGSIRVWAQRV